MKKDGVCRRFCELIHICIALWVMKLLVLVETISCSNGGKIFCVVHGEASHVEQWEVLLMTVARSSLSFIIQQV